MSSTKTVSDLFKLNISISIIFLVHDSSQVPDTVLHAPGKKRKRKPSFEGLKGKTKWMCTNCNKDESFGLGNRVRTRIRLKNTMSHSLLSCVCNHGHIRKRQH